MRLDHLLSKEHHEKGAASGACSGREESLLCSGAGLVRNNKSPPAFWVGAAESLNTLLGPETTPVLKDPGWSGDGPVVSLHLGGGVWCLFIG